MKAQLKQLNKDLGYINTLIERKNIKKKHKDQRQQRKSRKALSQKTKIEVILK